MRRTLSQKKYRDDIAISYKAYELLKKDDELINNYINTISKLKPNITKNISAKFKPLKFITKNELKNIVIPIDDIIKTLNNDEINLFIKQLNNIKEQIANNKIVSNNGQIDTSFLNNDNEYKKILAVKNQIIEYKRNINANINRLRSSNADIKFSNNIEITHTSGESRRMNWIILSFYILLITCVAIATIVIIMIIL